MPYSASNIPGSSNYGPEATQKPVENRTAPYFVPTWMKLGLPPPPPPVRSPDGSIGLNDLVKWRMYGRQYDNPLDPKLKLPTNVPWSLQGVTPLQPGEIPRTAGAPSGYSSPLPSQNMRGTAGLPRMPMGAPGSNMPGANPYYLTDPVGSGYPNYPKWNGVGTAPPNPLAAQSVGVPANPQLQSFFSQPYAPPQNPSYRLANPFGLPPPSSGFMKPLPGTPNFPGAAY